VIRPARILLAGQGVADSADSLATLEAAHHVVRACAHEQVVSAIESFRPDLVIIDIREDRDSAVGGVVGHLHASYRPLVLCTIPHDSPSTPLLDAGADACLAQPFEQADLEVQVRAVLRRAPWLSHAVLQVGSLVIDESAHVALYDDQPLTLTTKEYGILVALAVDAGTVVSKRSLLDRLWGFELHDENLVEAHVSGLRRHLPPGANGMLQTVRGVGYVLRADSAQDHDHVVPMA
jgi:DNA-binding response OmpR family regulator